MSANPNALYHASDLRVSAAGPPLNPKPLPRLSRIFPIHESKQPSSELLQRLVDGARTTTCAGGAALALRDTRGNIVCRARSGDAAPDLGALVNSEHGFSGECVRTAQPLLCRDAELDGRVDAAVRGELGVRSIAVVPVTLGPSEVIGILEVLSERANAFNTAHVETLEGIAMLVSAAAEAAAGSAEHPSAPAVTAGYVETELGDYRRPGVREAVAVACCVALVLGTLSGTYRPLSGPIQVTLPEQRELGTRISAAESGDADAQYALGISYVRGEQGRTDYEEAARWLARAAEQGHIRAQSALASVHWAGRGVAQDLVSAYMWSAVAAVAGDSASRDRVQALVPFMSKQDIAEAQRRAATWLLRHPSAPTPATSSNSPEASASTPAGAKQTRAEP
jgi:GAF domain-containing protein